MWFLNGCNPFTQNHVYRWTGSTTNKYPWHDVECGCGAFIMKANTGEIVPSQRLLDEMAYVTALEAGDDDD